MPVRFKCRTALDITKWHRWFAWHPVKVEAGYCCWLETVERRCGRPEIGGVWQAWLIWLHRLKALAPNRLFGTYIIGEDAV